jgi:hypothetical protein
MHHYVPLVVRTRLYAVVLRRELLVAHARVAVLCPHGLHKFETCVTYPSDQPAAEVNHASAAHLRVRELACCMQMCVCVCVCVCFSELEGLLHISVCACMYVCMHVCMYTDSIHCFRIKNTEKAIYQSTKAWTCLPRLPVSV